MNSYGYIYGLSASTGNVSEVRVYDNTSHVYLYSSGVQWGGYWGVPQGLRWYCNGMTPGHNYSVRIIPNGFAENSLIETLTVPSNSSYRWPDFNFYGLY